MSTRAELVRRNHSIARASSILAILTSAVIAMRFVPMERFRESLSLWLVSHGAWGWPAFALIYAALTIALVPGALMTIMAGALFGIVLGFVLASIGSTTGAAIAFLVARYVARGRVERFANQYASFAAIDEAIGQGGWKVVALTRLSPVIPFNAQNYLYGITKVGFWSYLLASWVGMMPGTLMYVYLGHVAGMTGSPEQDTTITEWLLLLVGLVATISVTVYVTLNARRKLGKLNARAEKERKANDSHSGSDGGEFRTTMLYIAGAALSIGITGFVAWRGERVLSDITSWFGIGPPAVVMQESYEPKPDGPSVDHSQWTALLQRHVTEGGWIDYEGIRRDEKDLDRYLEIVAEAPFEALGRNQKLALLINAYNAFTLKLIAENYPLDSIKDIPSRDRWQARRWNVGGRVLSLNQIEHEEIRPHFKEPRIHFALVCAAVGCPPLVREAYEADRLEAQLQRQTEFVFSHETWFESDTPSRTLFVTPLLNWYRGDFEQDSGTLIEYLSRYSKVARQMAEQHADVRIAYLNYDWKLNGIENRAPR